MPIGYLSIGAIQVLRNALEGGEGVYIFTHPFM